MEMMMNQQIPGCPIFRQSWMSKSNIELGFGWASVLWIQGIAVPLMVSFNTSREHGGKAWHIQHKEPFVESSWNSLICSTCPSRFLWYTHSSLHQIDGPDIHKYLLILIHVDKSQTIYGAYPPVEHNAYIYICKYPFFRWFIYSHMSNTCSFPSLRTETVTFTTFTIPFLPWGYSQSVRSRESSHPVTIGSMKHQETPAILPIYPVLPPEILQYTVHLCSTAWCCPTAKFVAQKIWQQDKKRKKLPTSSNPPGWSRPNDFPKTKARNHCVCQTFIFALLKSQETVG